MNRFQAWMTATLTTLVLMAPAAVLAKPPHAFPLPPPGTADGPASPSNDTERPLADSWVADVKYKGAPGYYHLQFAQHAGAIFQDKQGDYGDENRWDWSVQPGTGDGFILTLGGKRWQCQWNGPDEFDMTGKDGHVTAFYRNR